jgi:GNAT superfamily N-acetyltransferase
LVPWWWIPHSAAELQPALDMDLVLGVEVGNTPAAFAIGLPDLNQVFIHLGGRLFPFGWLKWLWYRRRVTRARLLLMGVDPAYQGQGLEAWLVARLAQLALERGYEWVDLSWITENNQAVQGIIRHVCGPHGVRSYRTYRLYEMAISRGL